ncbi:MAG TPA: hypothetical protein VKM72_23170, partial [Thermoanaerobaculia bacterium]|nr:hypothetical protein [Thermoanaerobaculia bacterium]
KEASRRRKVREVRKALHRLAVHISRKVVGGTVRNFVLGPYDAAEGAIVCHDANSPRSRMSCWTSS